jgi:hypothetical protein
MDQETPAVKLRLRLAAMRQARTRLANSLRLDTDVELNSRMYADSVRKYRQAVQEIVATLHAPSAGAAWRFGEAHAHTSRTGDHNTAAGADRSSCAPSGVY